MRSYNIIYFFKGCLHDTFKILIGDLKNYQVPLRLHGLKDIPFRSSGAVSQRRVIPCV